MILACQNISKSFGSEEILQNVSFHIEENEKAAIVGINGAGKTTLLKIIMQILEADSGEVVLAKNRSIGYLAQHQNIDGQRSILEEILSARSDILDLEKKLHQMEEELHMIDPAVLEEHMDLYHKTEDEYTQKGGYAYRSEVVGVLRGLGFEEHEKDIPVQLLSGGQKTRVSLGKLLVTKPDILILDEPTNHLDLNAITWLESYLSSYRGAVLLVSHDRYFLNKIVTKVIELFLHKSTMYLGNYTEYTLKKSAVREAMQKAYDNQQREIKHQEDVITKLKSFNREKSIRRAESREKMLDKIERLDRPVEENTDIHLTLKPSIISGNDVLKAANISKSFEQKHLFDGIDFEIKRGDRIALIGENGTGKTTLLKIINQLIPADNGTFSFGVNVTIGYYDQDHNVLHDEKTIYGEISDEYPNLTQTQIRSILAAFLFSEDDVFKRICDLSGGEKGRVSLAKLMLSEANFLILDEPTNHLDIVSREILEQALRSYEGTVLYVSHDRYFISQTATRIFELKHEKILDFHGSYDYFLEKYDTISLDFDAGYSAEKETSDSEVKTDWRQQKSRLALVRKQERELKLTEEKIASAEKRIKEIHLSMSHEEVAINSAKLNELHVETEQLESSLKDLYEKWEYLSEEMESFE
ncbi:MAG: ribosomal protection-like ABC-F family protein [Lachnospiraceae bacterium]